MAGIFHNQVRLHSYDFQDAQLTVNLKAGIVKANEGLAVSWDDTADDTVKLAGDGDPICGVLYTVEDRKTEGKLVGTVKFRFAERLKVKSDLAGGQVVARGSRLCGAGNGEVRALVAGTDTTAAALPAPRVTRVESAGATALFI